MKLVDFSLTIDSGCNRKPSGVNRQLLTDLPDVVGPGTAAPPDEPCPQFVPGLARGRELIRCRQPQPTLLPGIIPLPGVWIHDNWFVCNRF